MSCGGGFWVGAGVRRANISARIYRWRVGGTKCGLPARIRRISSPRDTKMRLVAAVAAAETHDEVEQGHYRLQGAGDVGPSGGAQHRANMLLVLPRHDTERIQLGLGAAAGVEFDGQI